MGCLGSLAVRPRPGYRFLNGVDYPRGLGPGADGHACRFGDERRTATALYGIFLISRSAILNNAPRHHCVFLSEGPQSL
jgi:hypothetical protein